LIAATRRLLSAGASGIIVIGIHGLFADRAYDELRAMGVSQIVSCNTVTHPSNAIDVTALLAKAVEKLTRA
jgi:ribose-phosphate pyrophosphokinase